MLDDKLQVFVVSFHVKAKGESGGHIHFQTQHRTLHRALDFSVAGFQCSRKRGVRFFIVVKFGLHDEDVSVRF